MKKTCAVCKHPDREAIDALLQAGGQTQEEVGAAFGISQSSISRHVQRHLVSALAQVERRTVPLVGEVPPEIVDSLARLAKLEAMLWRGAAIAEAQQELDLLPRFARELARVLELEKLFSPNYRRAEAEMAEARGAVAVLQDVILAALADHPEARQRVAAALVASEQEEAP